VAQVARRRTSTGRSRSFYILSGTVALYDGASWAEGTAGDLHDVPEGGIHAFRNADPDTPARLVVE
jgi:quercetin dioxygenase-like cupin family protein